MRKRILAAVLCFCMVLGVCSCGKTDEPVEKANTATKTTETGEKAEITPNVSQMTIEELKLTRERIRSEMKEPLLMLIDSPNVTDEEKQKAVAQLNDIACISEKEREAELLLEAKGFENIVEIFDGEKCNVTLVCDNMSDIERQQIADIVKEKTEISADKIVITAISN